MATKLVTNSILFIIIIISGVWLAKLGKPYKPLAFNIHKFITLAFIVYTIMLLKVLIKTIEMSSLHWLLLILSGICVLLTLVSGGILSSKEEIMKPLILVHKISSAFALLSILSWFYFSLKQ